MPHEKCPVCFRRFATSDEQFQHARAKHPPSNADQEKALKGLVSAPLVVRPGSGWNTVLHGCAVLGGYGFDIPKNVVDIEFSELSCAIHAGGSRAVWVSWERVVSLEVSGPGAVTTGGGYMGGGIGLEGAAVGMLMAGALNAATTRTSVDTRVYLATGDGEAFFRYSLAGPDELRIKLSPAFVKLRILRASRTDESV